MEINKIQYSIKLNNNLYNKSNENLKYKISIDNLSENSINFKRNTITKVKNYINYWKVRNLASDILKKTLANKINLKDLGIEAFEGIQYGIKAFVGLSMKEIYTLSKNIQDYVTNTDHNSYFPYIERNSQEKEFLWEDFDAITDGLKKIRKRSGKLNLFSENITLNQGEKVSKNNLFENTDCLNITLKDRKANTYDFRDLVTKLYENLNQTTTLGAFVWSANNKTIQQRAENYANYFSKDENMDKLTRFNLVFDISDVVNELTLKSTNFKEIRQAKTLQQESIENFVNAIFTLTPLLGNPKFNICLKETGSNNTLESLDLITRNKLIKNIGLKLKRKYERDFSEEQKFCNTKTELVKNLNNAINKILEAFKLKQE